MPACLQRQGEVQRSLAAELHDHPDLGPEVASCS